MSGTITATNMDAYLALLIVQSRLEQHELLPFAQQQKFLQDSISHRNQQKKLAIQNKKNPTKNSVKQYEPTKGKKTRRQRCCQQP